MTSEERRRPKHAAPRDAAHRDAAHRDASLRDAAHRDAAHRDASLRDAATRDGAPRTPSHTNSHAEPALRQDRAEAGRADAGRASAEQTVVAHATPRRASAEPVPVSVERDHRPARRPAPSKKSTKASARRAAALRSQAPQTAMSPEQRTHHGIINFIVALVLFLIALALIFVGKTLVLDKKELTPSNVVSSLTSTLEGVPGAISSLVPGVQPKMALPMRAPALTKAASCAGACAASATTAAKQASTNSRRSETFAVRAGDPPGSDVASDRKTLYLTFDDGPSKNTQAVLDVLDRYGIKATFFVTGIDPDYAGMIKVAHDKGNTIGLHTYSHDYASVYASVDAYFADLDAIGRLVKEQIGYVPCFIRFPGGSSNAISANYARGIMTTLAGEVQARGYQYYDWDASCGDGSVHTADETEYFATEGCGAVGMQNVIMLLHDSATKDTTAAALPAIIEYWRAQGYEFAAIARDTRYAHHGIGN